MPGMMAAFTWRSVDTSSLSPDSPLDNCWLDRLRCSGSGQFPRLLSQKRILLSSPRRTPGAGRILGFFFRFGVALVRLMNYNKGEPMSTTYARLPEINVYFIIRNSPRLHHSPRYLSPLVN